MEIHEKFLPVRTRWMNTEIILHQTIGGNIITFMPNFEAFVMMARSITEILKKDMTHVDGFGEWYAKKCEWLKSDSVCKFFADLRVVIYHRHSITYPTKVTSKNKKKWLEEPIIFLIQIPGTKIKIEKIELNNHDRTESILEQYEKKYERYVIAERQDLDLIYLGCSYLNKLKELLDECVQLFTDRENIDHLRVKEKID